MGVHLEVTPELREDGFIDLSSIQKLQILLVMIHMQLCLITNIHQVPTGINPMEVCPHLILLE